MSFSAKLLNVTRACRGHIFPSVQVAFLKKKYIYIFVFDLLKDAFANWFSGKGTDVNISSLLRVKPAVEFTLAVLELLKGRSLECLLRIKMETAATDCSCEEIKLGGNGRRMCLICEGKVCV